MARNTRDSKNNNPQGRNQYSGGVMDIARDSPFAAAATAAVAVGAGVFLWSRRNQISDQISNLNDQFGEWRDSTSAEPAFDPAPQSAFTSGNDFKTGKSSRQPKPKSQREVAEEAMTLKQTGETGPNGI